MSLWQQGDWTTNGDEPPRQKLPRADCWRHRVLPHGMGLVMSDGAAHADISVLEELSQGDTATLAETFRLLGDPSRLRILMCCMKGSASVGEIAECLELSQSLVSHHLRLLRGARLVKGVRQAKQVIYEIADSHVSQVLLDMASHIAEDHADD